ncbi:MAG: hypothetical protein KAS19_00620 [Anaerolineales bacterium]|nr:hypothetical protein [Anaerolineales bacterium]
MRDPFEIRFLRGIPKGSLMLCHGRVLVEPFHLKNIVDLKVPLNKLIPGTLKEVQLVDVTQDPPDQQLFGAPCD